MNLAEPIWLAALGLLPPLAILATISLRRRHRLLGGLFRGEVLERILPSAVVRRRWLGLLLGLLGLGLVALALAEPRYGKQVREVERTGVDVVIAVDLSRSMDAQDVEPSRLGRAQRELYDLVEMLDGDRIGLVIYAGAAYGRMPLTLDYDAFELLVRELDTRTFAQQGSNLAAAIRESIKLLGEDTGTGRAILVLSDGEVHDSSEALAAADEAVDAAVRVYALGLGESAAPIPLADGRQLTWKGDRVISTPSADVLRDVAKRTGGAYVQSAASTEDMQRLYASGIRRTLEARTTGTTQRESWRSAFQVPLLAGLLLVALGAVLGESRRVVLLGAVLLAISPAHAATVVEGDSAYRSGDYAGAVEVFTELALEEPGDPDLWRRLGAARYRMKDFEGAASAYDRASRLSGRTDDLYASGNAHYNAGRLDEAMSRYEQVLARDAEHPGATRNRAILERELEQRMLEDPPPPPKPEPQPEGDEEGEQGEQSEQGESSEEGEEGEQGEQGEQGQQSSGAKGQEGADAEGGAEGDSEQGEGSSDPSGDPEGGGGAQESDGTDRTGEEGMDPDGGEGEEGELDSLDALRGEGEPGEGEAVGTSQGDSQGAGEGDGSMTSAQAERLLESVEEGRPRISIPGGRSEQPW